MKQKISWWRFLFGQRAKVIEPEPEADKPQVLTVKSLLAGIIAELGRAGITDVNDCFNWGNDLSVKYDTRYSIACIAFGMTIKQGDRKIVSVHGLLGYPDEWLCKYSDKDEAVMALGSLGHALLEKEKVRVSFLDTVIDGTELNERSNAAKGA